MALISIANFGGDKDVFPCSAAGFPAFPHLAFVVVYLGCVNHSIAVVEGKLNRPDARITQGSVGAKPEQRNFDIVI